MNRRDFLSSAAIGATALGTSCATPRPPGPRAAAAPAAPLAMWAMTGTLRSDDVRRQLDAFHGAGWGVVLYPRWGLDLDYLGDAFLERVRFIVEQAADRGMEAWLYDEFCWPSGHAKGLVTRDRPDLAANLLEVQPDGTSRVVQVPDSANLLLPAATQQFLAVTHERYAAALGRHLGRTVRAIFTDEPSLALQHRPRPAGDTAWRFAWSQEIDAALGGDFRPRLAAARDPATWPGWRDYWAAYTRIFHDAWVAPIASWCRDHDIAMSGHLLGEGDFGSQVAANGSLRRQLAAFGLPGIDEIHTRTDPAACEALTLSAIAELAGRERMVEVYALGPPHLSMDTMRAMVDLCAACGVDRYILAICPHDLSGGLAKREYLGVHGPQQPWFRDFARALTDHVAEAAVRARKAQPLGVPWPSDEDLWTAAGPDPKRSAALKAMTQPVVATAREAIRARLAPPAAGASTGGPARPSALSWTFEPAGFNSLRIDGPEVIVAERPGRAVLSVQSGLVRALRINGRGVDLAAAPADTAFDTSYRRVDVAPLLRTGVNRFEVDSPEAKPLRFLPALILWGDFAVDARCRLVEAPGSIPEGDWRSHGYPAFCGTGRYRATTDWTVLPRWLVLDTGGHPVTLTVNGTPVGRRAWPPFRFDLRGAARPGRNEIEVEITSTLGHLFDPAGAPPVGLLSSTLEP